MNTTPQADEELRKELENTLYMPDSSKYYSLHATSAGGEPSINGKGFDGKIAIDRIMQLIKARDEQREIEIQLKELRSFKDCFNDLQDAEEAMYIESNYIDQRIATLTQSSKGETK